MVRFTTAPKKSQRRLWRIDENCHRCDWAGPKGGCTRCIIMIPRTPPPRTHRGTRAMMLPPLVSPLAAGGGHALTSIRGPHHTPSSSSPTATSLSPVDPVPPCRPRFSPTRIIHTNSQPWVRQSRASSATSSGTRTVRCLLPSNTDLGAWSCWSCS